MNPLLELKEQKQSYWLDFIQRSLMSSGQLKKMIQEDGLCGMTSNPTIFQKAIGSGNEYDAAIKKLASSNKTDLQVFESLAIQDIQKACDILKPVYNQTKGLDGFVSLEVNPTLAYDTKGTLAEAKRLHKLVKRQNLMIKIPGTLEGLPAIEEATFAGINVNVTLLFSVEIYKKVFEAYMKGLERRVKKKLSISKISSVASFFVSRVDSAVNKKLDKLVSEGGSRAEAAKPLLHKTAIGNAKIAYAHYENVIASNRYQKLAKKGANVQRLLWASTGTKDKRLSDVVYVEELIGPDTVNTMPPATADAFKDHGTVEKRLRTGVDQAEADIAGLEPLGIDLDAITNQLQKDGVKSFIKSFEDLLSVVRAKRELLLGGYDKNMNFSLGRLKSNFENNLERISDENWIQRIWAKDASLWKSDEDHQKIIKNALGWLTVVNKVDANLALLEEIKKSVKKGKFTHVLLLGMGGSSLCPEVLRLTFGKKSGFPDFAILDSTEPASVADRAAWSKPEKTLFIVASKSGSTTEPNAFLSYFFDKVKKKKGAKAGENFIAITDPGTMMQEIAIKKKFRAIVLNPSDIGGRYSALSFFGMVPAAIMGIDVKKFLDRAKGMAALCSSVVPTEKNPGALLGTAVGTAAQAGRNKITFFLSKEVGTFGTWVEQLIAESTGKDQTGVLPVESEAIQKPDMYGDDRLFVSIRTKKDKDKTTVKKLKALEKAGHPVVWITINDKFDMAAQFFLWEMATAVSGGLIGINPFDQPNVQEAKDLTKRLISEFKSNGGFPEETPVFETSDFQVYSSAGNGHADSLKEVVDNFLNQAGDQDYVALLAYLLRDKKNESVLQEIRNRILKDKKVATTIGFGPRYLHSTGQYHKGGDNHGYFISITADDSKDLPIPGEGISYAVLKEAQARGDWEALKNKDRRVLHIHFKNANKGLAHLKDII